MRQGSPWKATRLMSRTTLKTKGKKEGKKSETRTHKHIKISNMHLYQKR